MRILLVGDDRDELDTIGYMLRRDGLTVIESVTAATARRRLRAERPDLVVACVAALSPAAFDVLRRLRAEDRTPLLVVTGAQDRPLLLRCLEAGADDIVASPYVFRELVLRIHALLRRTAPARDTSVDGPLRSGDLQLDPETHTVSYGGLALRLTPTEFRIFYVLVKNAERIVPSRRLLTDVWGGHADENSLRSHICHLRKKLRRDAESVATIASVPGVGYVYRAAVGGSR